MGFSQKYFKQARVSFFFIYKLNSRDSSRIYWASAVKVFVVLFSFSNLAQQNKTLAKQVVRAQMF